MTTGTPNQVSNERFEEHESDLYNEAARLVVAEQSASVSLIQRRLRIGFSRAMRFLDTMVEDGIVTAHDGLKGRSVLVGRDYFDRVDAQLREGE